MPEHRRRPVPPFVAALAAALALGAAAPAGAVAQDTTVAARVDTAAKKPKKDKDPDAPPDTTPKRLFREPSVPLAISIRTNLRALYGMRRREDPAIPATLTWRLGDAAPETQPIKVDTRGNWRLKSRNCAFPPVKLDIYKDSARKTLFGGQSKLKLVSRCEDRNGYEQYILQEYLLYQVYNLVTPLSMRARLVKAEFSDSLGKGKPYVSWAFLIEDDDDMAKRNGMKILEVQEATYADLDPWSSAVFAYFQYLIGNTDFSVVRLHNTRLVQDVTGNVHPVAYDFDFSGAVNARYAVTDPQLRIRTVRERLYRGPCLDAEMAERTAQHFLARKDAILALYDLPQLDPAIATSTRKYFTEFFETIADPRARQRRMQADCVPAA
jgi:hypothetical protein